MKLESRFCTARKTILATVTFMALASVAAAEPQDAPDANAFERSIFGDDWGVLSNDIFFGGARGMFGLSPASRMLVFSATSTSKSTSESNAIVDAARPAEDLFNFASSVGSPFAIARGPVSGGGGSFAPLAPNAITASGSWIGDADGTQNWSTTTNWSGGTVADGAGFTADFSTLNITGTRNVTVDTARTIGIINIGDTNGTNSYTFTASGGNSLTLDGNGPNAQINQTATSLGTTVSVPLLLNSSLDITNASFSAWLAAGGISANTAGTKTITTSTGPVTISGIIGNGAGVVAVTQSGPGTLTLSGNNTYTGGTTVSAGLLQLNSSSALGSSSGSLTVNGGVLNLNDQSVTVGNLTGSGGTIWNNLATQAVTLSIGNGNNGGGNYAGVIADRNIGGGTGTGTVALTKTGTGTITLSGANTYTGATTVDGGTLLVTGSTASGSAVTVNNSGTLGGTGTVSGTVQVNSGGTLSPGTSPGTLTTGAVTLANGSTFAVDLTAGSGNDLLVAPSVTLGTILIGPSLSLNITGTLAMWQEFFIVNNTGANDVSGVFAQGATVTSGDYTFLINYFDDVGGGAAGNDISLTVTAVPEPSTWIGAALALAAIGILGRRRRGRRSEVGSQ